MYMYGWVPLLFIWNFHNIVNQLCTCVLSHFSSVWLCNLMDCQTSLFVGFSRQEYWSGLPCSPPGGLPDPWIKPRSPVSPALAGRFFATSTSWKALIGYTLIQNKKWKKKKGLFTIKNFFKFFRKVWLNTSDAEMWVWFKMQKSIVVTKETISLISYLLGYNLASREIFNWRFAVLGLLQLLMCVQWS